MKNQKTTSRSELPEFPIPSGREIMTQCLDDALICVATLFAQSEEGATMASRLHIDLSAIAIKLFEHRTDLSRFPGLIISVDGSDPTVSWGNTFKERVGKNKTWNKKKSDRVYGSDDWEKVEGEDGFDFLIPPYVTVIVMKGDVDES